MKRALVVETCKVPFSTAEEIAAAKDEGRVPAVAGYHVGHVGQVMDLDDEVFASLEAAGKVKETTKKPLTLDVGRLAMETSEDDLASLGS